MPFFKASSRNVRKGLLSRKIKWTNRSQKFKLKIDIKEKLETVQLRPLVKNVSGNLTDLHNILTYSLIQVLMKKFIGVISVEQIKDDNQSGWRWIYPWWQDNFNESSQNNQQTNLLKDKRVEQESIDQKDF